MGRLHGSRRNRPDLMAHTTSRDDPENSSTSSGFSYADVDPLDATLDLMCRTPWTNSSRRRAIERLSLYLLPPGAIAILIFVLRSRGENVLTSVALLVLGFFISQSLQKYLRWIRRANRQANEEDTTIIKSRLNELRLSIAAKVIPVYPFREIGPNLIVGGPANITPYQWWRDNFRLRRAERTLRIFTNHAVMRNPRSPGPSRLFKVPLNRRRMPEPLVRLEALVIRYRCRRALRLLANLLRTYRLTSEAELPVQTLALFWFCKSLKLPRRSRA